MTLAVRPGEFCLAFSVSTGLDGLPQMPMNPYQTALANRLVQFVNETEQRKLTANEIEEIINLVHQRPFKLGQTWRKHCQACEVNGIGIARRRQTREVRYADQLCTQTDRFIALDDEDDKATATIAVKPPNTQSWPEPLSKHQIAYAIAHVKRTGQLPAILNKKLLAKGIPQSKIEHLCHNMTKKNSNPSIHQNKK